MWFDFENQNNQHTFKFFTVHKILIYKRTQKDVLFDFLAYFSRIITKEIL